MAIRQILCFPNPKLHRKSQPVAVVDDAIRTLVDDMLDTMYAAPGIGLAAPQVAVFKRVMVVDVSEDNSDPLVFINPEIVEAHGREKMEEGCLSVPEIYEMVERSERVTVRALDRDGNPFEMTAEGLKGVCIQHEIDHLNGKLFVDYLSGLKRTRIRKKLAKARRQAM